MPKAQANELLGYPPDSRLLILNADDLGMCHAINEAIFRTLTEGLVQSTSLMVPCPWALHAMRLLREQPQIDFSVHLTLICETVDYRWGPLATKERVPSLVDETGYFYTLKCRAELLAQAKLNEVETEFRTQIETVLAAKLKPTHLDWHCLGNGGREDIFDLTFGLAKEYGLALRVSGQALTEQMRGQGLPTPDHDLLDSYRVDISDKATRLAQLLRDLPIGLSEWAVHPGLGNAELQAIEPDSWQVRQSDFDFLMSQAAQAIVSEEGIILLGYRALQTIWNRG